MIFSRLSPGKRTSSKSNNFPNIEIISEIQEQESELFKREETRFRITSERQYM